jgi:hypothetical protein
VLGVCRSSYYAHKSRRRRPDGERLRLRAKVTELFNESRGAAGSRKLASPLLKLVTVKAFPAQQRAKLTTLALVCLAENLELVLAREHPSGSAFEPCVGNDLGRR